MIRAIQEYFGMSVFFDGDMFDDRKYIKKYLIIYWKPHAYYFGLPSSVKKSEMYAYTLNSKDEVKVKKAFVVRFGGYALYHVKELNE